MAGQLGDAETLRFGRDWESGGAEPPRDGASMPPRQSLRGRPGALRYPLQAPCGLRRRPKTPLCHRLLPAQPGPPAGAPRTAAGGVGTPLVPSRAQGSRPPLGAPPGRGRAHWQLCRVTRRRLWSPIFQPVKATSVRTAADRDRDHGRPGARSGHPASTREACGVGPLRLGSGPVWASVSPPIKWVLASAEEDLPASAPAPGDRSP